MFLLRSILDMTAAPCLSAYYNYQECYLNKLQYSICRNLFLHYELNKEK